MKNRKFICVTVSLYLNRSDQIQMHKFNSWYFVHIIFGCSKNQFEHKATNSRKCKSINIIGWTVSIEQWARTACYYRTVYFERCFLYKKKIKSNENIFGNYAQYFALISCKNELERVITITVSTMLIIKMKIYIIITLTWYFNYDWWIITPWTELMHL